MGHVINIHNSGHEIRLRKGKYKIDILGGWGVRLGEFSIVLRNIQSGQMSNCNQSSWPVQSFAFNKRAKRVFSIDIPEDGDYKVEFTNVETLQVKKTGLFFTGLFQKAIPNNKISIYIH